MAQEKPLYEDSKLKITFLQNTDGDTTSSLDHELWIKPETRYLLGRGILRDLALIHIGDLEERIRIINNDILTGMKDNNISIGDVELALKTAYVGELDRYSASLSKKNKEPWFSPILNRGPYRRR